jgi:hypothetical protein
MWACVADQAETFEFTEVSFFGESLILQLRPPTGKWAVVERSADLSTWSPWLHLITTKSQGIYQDQIAKRQPMRFYRIRAPGMDVAQARMKWLEEKVERYRFRFERQSRASQFFRLSGLVTVRNGQKTISEVRSWSQPVMDFDPEEFPTVDELFARLDRALQKGVRQAWMIYDERRGYPTEGLIDNLSTSPDSPGGDLFGFWLTEFTLEGEPQAVGAHKASVDAGIEREP